ncbi:GTPase IMAP family member 8-like isoform X2 [Etheostoma cragini]|uniref:GTPase IMAP family member 8-like isoform X2 n=1 Tax=Etheostoma cragini TaxID=417921 RepID=UPI00155F2663|nr:GTPase IMAP family member 8-like isoform X2 [Etheostoma cragini]
MENNFGENESITLPEVRLVLIGGRWAGKSSSGNTILGEERFECGRIRTAQSEKRRSVVGGRRLIVVDTPGWRSSLSLTEIPEVDKQQLKLNAPMCMPGPNVFLLVVPIDTAFSADSRRMVEEHMKLLGERVWRYTMVLFTCGDFLWEKNIEQHIESEGDSLKWLMERCSNRYQVFNNHEQSPSDQVTRLLEEIDEMLWHNNCRYYEVDEQTLDIMKKKQQEVALRAGERLRRSEEQRHQMKALIAGEMITIPKLHMVLLGSRSAGKTSLGNTLLGNKEQEVGKWTARSVARQGFLGQTEITLVDTPGWWKGFPVCDTPEAIKDELMISPFQCRPGPHVFLLVIDADASFNAKHLLAVTTHMDLLGEGVWRHTIVVFTRGDWLGTHTIEQYIEGEGEALQSLVEQCGNRYHVIDNKNADDGTQTKELLGKITETVAGNNWDYFVPDEKIYLAVEERKKSVKKGALVRQSQVHAKRKTLRDSSKELQELTVVMLGQKTSGKSATGNNLLCKEVFATCQNESCQVVAGEVAGRLVTVINTPGWRKDPSHCTKEMDIELVRGLSLSPLGVHAVLLVVPADLAFGEVQQAALEDHMNLFDASIWKHTLVVFTHGDKLADVSIEEHIEREHSALRWLIDKCENKYHVMNNWKKADVSQGTELFEKIDEMMAGNGEQLFCPEMNDIYLRIEEKFSRRQLKHVLKQRLKEEYQKRELKLMEGFKETLLKLQADIRGSVTSTKSMSRTKGIGQRKKDGKKKEENIDSKISQEIEKLEKDIRTKSSEVLRSSKDFLVPSLNGESPASSIAKPLSDRKSSTGQFNKVLGWLSTLQIGTNVDNQMTLKFSQTSGYGSVLTHNNLDFDKELMNES